MDNQELKARLEKIVSDRNARLPLVMARIQRLSELGESLELLREATVALPSEWADQEEVRDALSRLRDSELQTRLADARSSLENVRTRFSRTTVNIGVSGRARVGKSTLLQSVSGLSEEQVPTGEDVNVTAIRSRLFHASRRRAFVTFHNPTTFIDEAVRPYFAELGISPSPASLDAFVRTDLVGLLASRKESSALGQGEEMRWKRLMEVQAAVPGIRGLLTRGETVLEDLSGLRPYVAYPTVQQLRTELEGGQAAPREYLAVRDCRIESPFPETAVDRLGIVDLPGLGEVASGIDERIVSGLRDEVDVVLFLKRAAVGMANLDKIDMDAADLIGVAQGAIEDSRDFAWMVINASKGDSSLVEALQTQILKDMNFGQADSRYFTLVADARNAREVHERVLVPVLERLSDRLSDMDAAVLSAAVSDMQTPLLGVQAAAKALLTSVARVRTESGSPRQQLDILADEMLKDVQASLEELRPHTLGSEYVERYIEQVDDVHGGVRSWLDEGLGRFSTRAEWIEFASREAGVARSLRPFANEELHRLRVEITGRYALLDEYLNDVLVDEFYGSLCDAIAGVRDGERRRSEANILALLGAEGLPSAARIQTLLDNLHACDPPVPGLIDAVERLSGLKFDFRLQSYPVLHDLNLDRRPKDGAYPPDFNSVEVMYEWFSIESLQYSHEVRQALIGDANRQFKVLSGAAVVFEDEVIRSGRSKPEFRNLADGYRDELWPGKFNDLNGLSARARAFGAAAMRVQQAVNHALEADHG